MTTSDDLHLRMQEHEHELLQKFQEFMPNGEINQQREQQHFNDILKDFQRLEETQKGYIRHERERKYKLSISYNFQKNLEKILSWKELFHCVQKWEKIQLNQKFYQYEETLRQCQREWIREICQYEWVKILFFQTRLTDHYQLLRDKLLTLLVRTHFVSFAHERNVELHFDATSNDQKHTYSQSNMNDYKYAGKISLLNCEEVMKICQHKHTHELCIYTATKSPMMMTRDNALYQNNNFVNTEKIITNTLIRTKIHEIYQMCCEKKWWETIFQEDCIQQLYHQLFDQLKGDLRDDNAMELFELLIKTQTLKVNIVYLKLHHAKKLNEIWNTILSICRTNEYNFATDASYSDKSMYYDFVRKHEYSLVCLKKEVIEEQEIDLEKFEASLELLPKSQHQLKMILQYQLNKEKTNLKSDQKEFCREWKKWLIHNVRSELTDMLSYRYRVPYHQYIRLEDVISTY